MKRTTLFLLLALGFAAAVSVPLVLRAGDGEDSGILLAGGGCCPASSAESAALVPKGHAGPKAAAEGKKACADDCEKSCCASEKATAAHLAAALDHLDKATKAVKDGDTKTALAALAKARELVKVEHKAALGANAPDKAVVNATCPIMGQKVPAEPAVKLTRTFRGNKVGFCCAGCPAAWDKLSEDAKEEKLAAAKHRK